MNEFTRIASEVWADFDALMDVENVCYDINLYNRAEMVKRVSVACTQQVLSLLHELKQTDSRSLKKTINESYEYWENLYSELLKL